MPSLYVKKFLRVTAFLTAFFFTVNTLAWGQAVLLPSVSSQTPISVSNFNQPILIHLQDAHANYTAQKDMAQILERLRTGQGIKLVFVEGAVGRLDARYLKFTDNPELNEKIADKLARMGELTAADLFLLKNTTGLEFVGIENPDLYRRDIGYLRKVFRAEKENRRWIRENESALDRRITRLANKDLITALRLFLHLEKNSLSLTKTISTLDGLSRRHLGRDLRDAKEQKEFPNLVRVLKLKDEEGKIDQEKAHAEQKEIEKLGGKLDLETGNPRFELERFYSRQGAKGFDFKKYPEFCRYVRHLIFGYELRSSELFEEINRWTDLLLAQLAVTAEEKQSVQDIREAKLVAKLLLLELSRNEWKAIKGAALSSNAEDSRKFYELAEAREAAFIATIQKTLKAKNQNRAVVITGGFHTGALQQYFSHQHAGYEILSPRVEGDAHENYVKNMLGRKASDIEVSSAALVPWALDTARVMSLGVDASERNLVKETVIEQVAGKSLGDWYVPPGKININTASEKIIAEALELKPFSVQEIVRRRAAKPFSSLEELKDIRGIGSSTFDRLQHKIVLKPEDERSPSRLGRVKIIFAPHGTTDDMALWETKAKDYIASVRHPLFFAEMAAADQDTVNYFAPPGEMHTLADVFANTRIQPMLRAFHQQLMARVNQVAVESNKKSFRQTNSQQKKQASSDDKFRAAFYRFLNETDVPIAYEKISYESWTDALKLFEYPKLAMEAFARGDLPAADTLMAECEQANRNNVFAKTARRDLDFANQIEAHFRAGWDIVSVLGAHHTGVLRILKERGINVEPDICYDFDNMSPMNALSFDMANEKQISPEIQKQNLRREILANFLITYVFDQPQATADREKRLKVLVQIWSDSDIEKLSNALKNKGTVTAKRMLIRSVLGVFLGKTSLFQDKTDEILKKFSGKNLDEFSGYLASLPAGLTSDQVLESVKDWVLQRFPEYKPQQYADRRGQMYFFNPFQGPGFGSRGFSLGEAAKPQIEFLSTIGYGKISIQEFTKYLIDNHIDVLVDVREFAYSSKEGFKREELERDLAKQNPAIQYIFPRGLGVPKEFRDQLNADNNLGKFRASYLQYLEKRRNILEKLVPQLAGKRVCLMSVEDDPAESHRSILREEILKLATVTETSEDLHFRALPAWKPNPKKQKSKDQPGQMGLFDNPPTTGKSLGKGKEASDESYAFTGWIKFPDKTLRFDKQLLEVDPQYKTSESQRLVAQTPDGNLAVTFRRNQELIARFSLPEKAEFLSAALNADGNILAIAFRAKQKGPALVRIIDVEARKLLREFPVEEGHQNMKLALNCDGSQLAIEAPKTGSAPLIHLYEISTGLLWRWMLVEKEITSLRFSSDGQYLFARHGEGSSRTFSAFDLADMSDFGNFESESGKRAMNSHITALLFGDKAVQKAANAPRQTLKKFWTPNDNLDEWYGWIPEALFKSILFGPFLLPAVLAVNAFNLSKSIQFKRKIKKILSPENISKILEAKNHWLASRKTGLSLPDSYTEDGQRARLAVHLFISGENITPVQRIQEFFTLFKTINDLEMQKYALNEVFAAVFRLGKESERKALGGLLAKILNDPDTDDGIRAIAAKRYNEIHPQIAEEFPVERPLKKDRNRKAEGSSLGADDGLFVSQNAERAMKEKRYEAAVEMLHQGLYRYPHDVVLWTQLANAYRYQRDLPQALKSICEAERINPEDERTSFAKAQILFEIGGDDKLNAAIAAIDTAIQLRPFIVQNYVVKIQILRKQKRFEEAYAMLKEIMTWWPEDPKLFGLKANLLSDLGKPKAALRAIRQGLKLHPDDYKGRMIEGDLLNKRRMRASSLGSEDSHLSDIDSLIEKVSAQSLGQNQKKNKSQFPETGWIIRDWDKNGKPRILCKFAEGWKTAWIQFGNSPKTKIVRMVDAKEGRFTDFFAAIKGREIILITTTGEVHRIRKSAKAKSLGKDFSEELARFAVSPEELAAHHKQGLWMWISELSSYFLASPPANLEKMRSLISHMLGLMIPFEEPLSLKAAEDLAIVLHGSFKEELLKSKRTMATPPEKIEKLETPVNPIPQKENSIFVPSARNYARWLEDHTNMIIPVEHVHEWVELLPQKAAPLEAHIIDGYLLYVRWRLPRERKIFDLRDVDYLEISPDWSYFSAVYLRSDGKAVHEYFYQDPVYEQKLPLDNFRIKLGDFEIFVKKDPAGNSMPVVSLSYPGFKGVVAILDPLFMTYVSLLRHPDYPDKDPVPDYLILYKITGTGNLGFAVQQVERRFLLKTYPNSQGLSQKISYQLGDFLLCPEGYLYDPHNSDTQRFPFKLRIVRRNDGHLLREFNQKEFLEIKKLYLKFDHRGNLDPEHLWLEKENNLGRDILVAVSGRSLGTAQVIAATVTDRVIAREDEFMPGFLDRVLRLGVGHAQILSPKQNLRPIQIPRSARLPLVMIVTASIAKEPHAAEDITSALTPYPGSRIVLVWNSEETTQFVTRPEYFETLVKLAEKRGIQIKDLMTNQPRSGELKMVLRGYTSGVSLQSVRDALNIPELKSGIARFKLDEAALHASGLDPKQVIERLIHLSETGGLAQLQLDGKLEKDADGFWLAGHEFFHYLLAQYTSEKLTQQAA